MPANPVVWIVLIVVAGLVVVLALWLGRGLKVKAKGIDLEIREGKAANGSAVTVFKEGRVGEGARVGNIIGVKNQPGEGGQSQQKVDVAADVEVKGSVGDIVGVEFSKEPPDVR